MCVRTLQAIHLGSESIARHWLGIARLLARSQKSTRSQAREPPRGDEDALPRLDHGVVQTGCSVATGPHNVGGLKDNKINCLRLHHALGQSDSLHVLVPAKKYNALARIPQRSSEVLHRPRGLLDADNLHVALHSSTILLLGISEEGPRKHDKDPRWRVFPATKAVKNAEPNGDFACSARQKHRRRVEVSIPQSVYSCGSSLPADVLSLCARGPEASLGCHRGYLHFRSRYSTPRSEP
mmetsp:Transcript_4007/g.9345  ORF Transcript_4007/g.9345 Transcript_4007/m.9345 type:complete len:238 (+) Transcript_4007:1257-1970(+)